MPCPPEIARILAQILSIGLLRARASGWNHDSDRCAIEADHLHNLPALLVDYDPALLHYYWNAERVGFMQRSACDEIAAFQPLWNALAEQIGAARGEEATTR